MVDKIKHRLLLSKDLFDPFKDYFKRLVIFLFLLLIYISIATYLALIIRGAETDKVFMFFKNYYIEMIFKVLVFGFLFYSIYYFLYPIVTKKKWLKDELYIKYQILGFSLGIGIGLLETYLKLK